MIRNFRLDCNIFSDDVRRVQVRGKKEKPRRFLQSSSEEFRKQGKCIDPYGIDQEKTTLKLPWRCRELYESLGSLTPRQGKYLDLASQLITNFLTFAQRPGGRPV
jgi:hypothetical protein